MAAKKEKSEYVALYSECGEDSQLKTIGGDDACVNLRDSIEAAKTDASDHAKSRRTDGDDPCDYVIAQVVARGSAAELIWK